MGIWEEAVGSIKVMRDPTTPSILWYAILLDRKLDASMI